MKKFFKIIGVLLLVLIAGAVGGGYYFLKTFDLNKYKSYAENLVFKETGRKLAINGDADLGISLIPTLIVNDVELANPSWAKQPQMVKIKQLELKFALLPLLRKEVMIDTVALVQPEIYLEQSVDGKASWDFSKPVDASAAKEIAAEKVEIPAQVKNAEDIRKNVAKAEEVGPATAVLAGFAAKNVSIENGVVQFNDQKSKQVTNVKINNFELSADSLDDPITAAFDVVYDNQKLKGQTTLGSINQFLAADKPFPVKLSATAFGVNVNADGTVSNVLKTPEFAVNANVYNPAGNMNAPETTLVAKVSGDAKKVKADISTLNVANNLVKGTVSADMNGKKPMINANLSSDRFDLTSLNPAQPLAWNLPEVNFISTAQASQLVPNTPVPYAALMAVNANAVVNIKQLIIDQGMTADNVSLTANLIMAC